MYFDQNGWREIFQGFHLLWHHDGNPRRPHVELTTDGFHSDGFFNWSIVAKSDWLVTKVAKDLLELIGSKNIDLSEVEQIIGPGEGATSLIKNIARQIKRPYAIASKVKGGVVKEFRFENIEQINRKYFPVDDTISTGRSVLQVAKKAEELGAIRSLSVIAAVCNRSGQREIEGYQIIALINEKMASYRPEECPLCEAGSEAIRAKANWEKLNGNY
ncbi:MAG: hypothetical protein Q7R65_00320 [bacterium]|nr:hypothetical protein [bacterium]